LLRPGANDPDDAPALRFRERTGLHDLDDVANVGRVGFVVSVADGPALQQLAIESLVSDCAFWGDLSEERLRDLEAAIAASRIVVLRRARGLTERRS